MMQMKSCRGLLNTPKPSTSLGKLSYRLPTKFFQSTPQTRIPLFVSLSTQVKISSFPLLGCRDQRVRFSSQNDNQEKERKEEAEQDRERREKIKHDKEMLKFDKEFPSTTKLVLMFFLWTGAFSLLYFYKFHSSTESRSIKEIKSSAKTLKFGKDDNIEIHLNCVQANYNLEDRHVEEPWEGKGLFVGVFDGHAGTDAVNKVEQELVLYSKWHLNEAYENMSKAKKSTSSQSNTVSFPLLQFKFLDLWRKAFTEADDMFIKTYGGSDSLRSGACALLSYIDYESANLVLANAGDCRAVLGKSKTKGGQKEKAYVMYDFDENVPRVFKAKAAINDPSTDLEAIQLTQDHQVTNKREYDRLKREHPNESNLFEDKRVKGMLEPTRAFGDSFFKFKSSAERLGYLAESFGWTAPYVTAAPEISIYPLSEEDQVLVLATDGLWGFFGVRGSD
eukprot:TRINITY_DN3401_c0_g1_i1.p1 TRINITY_DN3401_c0_g1~~TRINITY_DN3401_c0_g1_i1.p1  ORF type:complete len:463 (+),score=107.23 TRINITY_DN3401_c0_g1_i1:46-1389(+)